MVGAFSGVLIGEYEVRESRDGDIICHQGKGAIKVADNTCNATVLVSTGSEVME